MIATYAAVVVVCGASLAFGQAAIALCGARRWSWLAPAVGLALLCALSWATVRLPGGGVTSAAILFALIVGASTYLRWHSTRERSEGPHAPAQSAGRVRDELLVGLPVAVLALVAVSVPFVAAGHFGILGTGFNPDMSQHLLAADRLGDDVVGDLWRQGYPLGPHAVVIALDGGLGTGLVPGFTGFTIAVAVLAALTALAAFSDRPHWQRVALALVVGLPYLVASYYAQSAFKETAQALLVLAFLLALRESDRDWRHLTLRFVPAAAIAIGVVYVYSFPGLIWLVAIAIGWFLIRRSVDLSAISLALLVFAVATLPELGRMLDFQRFETFDPNGPGLGNLFGQVSPFTALGIWPSGDFRVAPGDGAVPALAFWLGAAFAAALLALGLHRARKRREHAILAAVLAVIGVYVAARVAGTPYTAAKALAIAAPVLTLAVAASRRVSGVRDRSTLQNAGGGVALAAYVALAGACSLLALANAPVGPRAYSPALVELRPAIAAGSTLVLAPDRMLAEEEGYRYLVWELRGGRVCVEPLSTAGTRPPDGVAFVLAPVAGGEAPYPGLRMVRRADEFTLWRRPGASGPGPCPLIAERQARAGAD